MMEGRIAARLPDRVGVNARTGLTQTTNCRLSTASYRAAFPRDPQKRRRAAALQEGSPAGGLRPTPFPSILNVPLP